MVAYLVGVVALLELVSTVLGRPVRMAVLRQGEDLAGWEILVRRVHDSLGWLTWSLGGLVVLGGTLAATMLTMFLYRCSPRMALVRLGLRRPRSLEVVVPLVCCLVISLAAWILTRFADPVEVMPAERRFDDGGLAAEVLAFLLVPAGTIAMYGFLYAGLRRLGGQSDRQAGGILFGFACIKSLFIAGFSPELLALIALAALAIVASVVILEHHEGRLVALVVLALGVRLMWMPFDVRQLVAAGGWAAPSVLAILPAVLAAIAFLLLGSRRREVAEPA